MAAANAARRQSSASGGAGGPDGRSAERRLDALFGTGNALAVYGTLAPARPNHHVLGAVSEGRITCQSRVVHRTRRTATAEAKVYDSQGNLVAMGTGAFRVFERKGNAIV